MENHNPNRSRAPTFHKASFALLLMCFIAGIANATAAGNVSCGVNLDTVGALYTMNASSTINGANCFNVTAANVTLDCMGWSITGSNASSTNGIFSDQFNTTVENCNISNFAIGIKFSGATNGMIQRTNASTTRASNYGMQLLLSSSCVVTNVVTSSYGYIGMSIAGGENNIFANSTATSSSDRALSITTTSKNNSIYNNTLTSASGTVLYIDNANNNSVFLNRFSSSGTYVSDSTGTNVYNATYNGINQGNIYPNVLNGSVVINSTGTVSSLAGYLVGDGGSGYPYGNDTSQGKFSCAFAGCADYAPLILIPNIASTITAISVLPASPSKATSLSCSLTVTDPEQATTNISGYWYKNGTNQSALAFTYNNLANNTVTNISNLTSGNFSKNENWSCQAIAFDGTDYSSLSMSANVTIANSAPTQAYGVVFVNSTTNHTFTATSGVTDLDGAADITGSNISTTAGTCVQISNASAANNFNTTYRCTGTAPGTPAITMGYTDASGAYVAIGGVSNAYPDHVANLTAPSVTATLYPNSTATCTNGSYSDIDADIENVTARTWKWYWNGSVVAGQTNQTFNLSLAGVAIGDNVSCWENATNTTWTGSYASNMSANVTVLNYPFSYSNGSLAQVTATANSNVAWTVAITVSNGLPGVCAYNFTKLGWLPLTTITNSTGGSVLNNGTYNQTSFNCSYGASPYTVTFYTEPVNLTDTAVTYPLSGTSQQRLLLSTQYMQNLSFQLNYTPGSTTALVLWACTGTTNATCGSGAAWSSQTFSIIGGAIVKSLTLTSNETVFVVAWDASGSGGSGGGGGGGGIIYPTCNPPNVMMNGQCVAPAAVEPSQDLPEIPGAGDLGAKIDAFLKGKIAGISSAMIVLALLLLYIAGVSSNKIKGGGSVQGLLMIIALAAMALIFVRYGVYLWG